MSKPSNTRLCYALIIRCAHTGAEAPLPICVCWGLGAASTLITPQQQLSVPQSQLLPGHSCTRELAHAIHLLLPPCTILVGPHGQAQEGEEKERDVSFSLKCSVIFQPVQLCGEILAASETHLLALYIDFK